MTNKVKLDTLTVTDMLLMVEKGFRGGIWHAIHQYAKANKNTSKIIIKIKNLCILNTGRHVYQTCKN